jgi:hypothetical protein
MSFSAETKTDQPVAPWTEVSVAGVEYSRLPLRTRWLGEADDLVLAMTPSAEIITGEVTLDCCAPFPGSVSLSSDGFDLSVDPVSKPARLGASRIETAETWVFPAGLPFGGADVVQIVVVRPTSGMRPASEAPPWWPSTVPAPRINSRPIRTAPSVMARRAGRLSLGN